MHELVIVGAGPAGLTSLLYAAHYDIKTICLGSIAGGKLLNAPGIIDFPGIEKIDGKAFIDHLLTQIKMVNGVIENHLVTAVSHNPSDSSYSIKTQDGSEYQTKALIIATGNGKKQPKNTALELAEMLDIETNNGFIHVDSFGRTNKDGVFAAGDCISFPQSLEQLTTAVATGITAAAGAYFFLRNQKPPILWGISKIPRV